MEPTGRESPPPQATASEISTRPRTINLNALPLSDDSTCGTV
jgi:hypothetical protein